MSETVCLIDSGKIVNGRGLFMDDENLKMWHSDLSSLEDGWSMFWRCTNLESFNFISETSAGNLSKLKSGYNMLSSSKIEVFYHDISSLEDSSGMFNGCKNLYKCVIPANNFIVSAVEMFEDCDKLAVSTSGLENSTNLYFDHLENGIGMFSGCKLYDWYYNSKSSDARLAFVTLNFGNNLSRIGWLFSGSECGGVTLNLPKYYKTTDVQGAFKLAKIHQDVIINYSERLSNCSELFREAEVKNIKLEFFSRNYWENSKYMFYNSSIAGDLSITGHDGNHYYYYYDEIDLGKENFFSRLSSLTKIVDAASMFEGIQLSYDFAINETAIPGAAYTVGDGGFFYLQNASNMFANVNGLVNLYLQNGAFTGGGSGFNGTGMFRNCTNLSKVAIENCSMKNCNNADFMFEGCTYLDYVLIDGNSSLVSASPFYLCDSYYGMFSSCSNLRDVLIRGTEFVKLSRDGNHDVSCGRMFQGCTSLEKFETYYNKNAQNYSDCYGSLPVTDGYMMFSGCSSLQTVSTTFPKLKTGEGMFEGCKLNSSSVMYILASLPTVTSSPILSLTMSTDGCENGAGMMLALAKGTTIPKYGSNPYSITYRGWNLKLTCSSENYSIKSNWKDLI